jgi:hypothetical protein
MRSFFFMCGYKFLLILGFLCGKSLGGGNVVLLRVFVFLVCFVVVNRGEDVVGCVANVVN